MLRQILTCLTNALNYCCKYYSKNYASLIGLAVLDTFLDPIANYEMFLTFFDLPIKKGAMNMPAEFDFYVVSC